MTGEQPPSPGRSEQNSADQAPEGSGVQGSATQESATQGSGPQGSSGTETNPADMPWRSRVGLRFLKVTRAQPGEAGADGSRWPGSRKQFLWDLVPGDIAPGSDGVIPPSPGRELDWTDDVPDEKVEKVFETARRYRQDADDTTRNLELKAARLATVLVALLTANVALVVYELTRLGPDPSTLRIVLVIASVGFGIWSARWLVPGLIQAVDADQRMGITSVSTLAEVVRDPRSALRSEAHGYATSNWTRKNKADTLIFARAAVSRSIVYLLVSVVIAIALAFNTTLAPDHPSHKSPGSLHRHDLRPGYPDRGHPARYRLRPRPPTPMLQTTVPPSTTPPMSKPPSGRSTARSTPNTTRQP